MSRVRIVRQVLTDRCVVPLASVWLCCCLLLLLLLKRQTGPLQAYVDPQFYHAVNNHTCKPRHNIAFLKSHKCASSAIQNILFRYGLSRGLSFALPPKSNYFGRPESFRAEMLRSSSGEYRVPNIFAIHTKWNHQQIKKVMPDDTVYLSIVREPSDLFISLYTYYNFEEKYNMTMKEYLQWTDISTPRHSDTYGYNQMTWDFGLATSDINDLTAVQNMVALADEQFHLVMVVERMEESLVLLSHLLCVALHHVLVLKVNVQSTKQYQEQSIKKENLRVMLRQKLAADYILYEHFLKRLDERINDFGRERMSREVEELRILSQDLQETCGFKKIPNKYMGNEKNKPWSLKVDGYIVASTSSSCQDFARSEMQFIDLLRRRQQQKQMTGKKTSTSYVAPRPDK